jgi:hypothetical protein
MAADIRTEQQKVTDATKKLAALKLIRQPHEALINEAIEFTYPGRMTINDTTKGQKKGATIYDTDATIACNLFGDGMHGYLFSPGWLKLRLPNTIEFGRATGMRRWSGKRADEIPEVAEWLVDSQDVMHGAFTRSNFYSVTPQVFKDWGCIGNVGVYGENDMNSGKICFTVPHIRELYISRDRYGGIDGVFRVYNGSLSNLVEKFGMETLRTKGGMIDIDQKMESDPYQELEITHAVYKRENYDLGKLNAQNKPWASMWIYNNKLLLESGFDVMPWVFWSAERNNNEWYGRSLVMNAIVEILTANQFGRNNLLTGGKIADPPYAMMESLRGRFNKGAGGNTYLKRGETTPEALLDHLKGIPFGLDMLDRITKRINAHLKTDVFLMMNQIAFENKNLTATQVVEMAGEKAAVISPITEGAENGLLNPEIDLVWHFEDQAGRIPQPPEVLMEYGGVKLEVDYYGPLSQARRRFYKSQGIRAGLDDIRAIAETRGVVNQTAPDVGDQIKWGRLTRYITLDSLPADCINSEDDAEKIAAERAQIIEQEKVNQGLIDAAKAVPGLNKKVEAGSLTEQVLGGGQ